MKVEDLFRLEERLQSNLKRYYLVCDVFASSKKFSASHLVKTGTKPTKSEILRSAGLFGFDLETVATDKAAKYSSEKFNCDNFSDDNDFYEIERFRHLSKLHSKMTNSNAHTKGCTSALLCPDTISRFKEVGLSPQDISKMFVSGKIPSGTLLYSINLIQNINNALKHPPKKRLTFSYIEKTCERLYNNLEMPALDSSKRKQIEDALSEFNKKISENYHPLEQCIVLRKQLEDIFDDEILAPFVSCASAKAFGYEIMPDVSTWGEVVDFVKNENARLEKEVRNKISTEFKIDSGARQRRLDYF